MKEFNYFSYVPEHKQYYSHLFMTDIKKAKEIIAEYLSKGVIVERYILERLNEDEEHYLKCQKEYKKSLRSKNN